jgi:hypothetical protein
MLETYVYVYKACQIIIRSEAERLWTYVVIFEDQHYEPFPARAFDCVEAALKAVTQFCDNRIENVTPIDGFHRRKNVAVHDVPATSYKITANDYCSLLDAARQIRRIASATKILNFNLHGHSCKGCSEAGPDRSPKHKAEAR